MRGPLGLLVPASTHMVFFFFLLWCSQQMRAAMQGCMNVGSLITGPLTFKDHTACVRLHTTGLQA